jgi:hypothetical protein
MGSSDPLPTGFEIRFGSLNFQAMGNGYLMRITNRDELRALRQNLATNGPRRTCRWDTNARQHGCCGPLSASTPSTFQSALSTSVDRAPTGCACRPVGRRAHRRDDSRSDGGAFGFRTAIPPRPARRYDSVRRLRQHRRGDAQGSPWPPCSGRQGPQHFRRRRVVPWLRQRAATRHLARVCGPGLLRRA